MRDSLTRIRQRVEGLLETIKTGRESGELPTELAEGLLWLTLGLWRTDGASSASWLVDMDGGVLRLRAEDCPSCVVPLPEIATAEGVLESVSWISAEPWATGSILSSLIVKAVELHGRQPRTAV
jgi:hypothetical protein